MTDSVTEGTEAGSTGVGVSVLEADSPDSLVASAEGDETPPNSPLSFPAMFQRLADIYTKLTYR